MVDDNPSIAKLACDLLAARGYDVSTTCEPQEVLRIVEALRPHLILMDVLMPGTDGLTLTRHLRSRADFSGTIIIAFTALAMKEDREKALAAGCNGYISKPIQIAKFYEAIEGFLFPAGPSKRGAEPTAREASAASAPCGPKAAKADAARGMDEEGAVEVQIAATLAMLGQPADGPRNGARTARVAGQPQLAAHLHGAIRVILALARAVEARDPFTRGHPERVARMATRLGVAAGLSREETCALAAAGYLHDIGMIRVPEAILHKPEPLTSEEWRIVRCHAEAGEKMLRPLASLNTIAPLVKGHHERLDGSGYPEGLKGQLIPVPVRILSIADVFDSLTSRRSYRAGMPTASALEVLAAEARKGWWDRELVELFATLQQREPGSFL